MTKDLKLPHTLYLTVSRLDLEFDMFAQEPPKWYLGMIFAYETDSHWYPNVHSRCLWKVEALLFFPTFYSSNHVCTPGERLAVTEVGWLRPLFPSTWNNVELQSLRCWPQVNIGKIMWSELTPTQEPSTKKAKEEALHGENVLLFGISSVHLFVCFFTFNIAVLK